MAEEVDDAFDEEDPFLEQPLDNKQVTIERVINEFGSDTVKQAYSKGFGSTYRGMNDSNDEEDDDDDEDEDNDNDNDNGNDGNHEIDNWNDLINDAENDDEFLASDVLGPKRRRYNKVEKAKGLISMLNDSDDEFDENGSKIETKYKDNFNVLFQNDNTSEQETLSNLKKNHPNYRKHINLLESNGNDNNNNNKARRRGRGHNGNKNKSSKFWEDKESGELDDYIGNEQKLEPFNLNMERSEGYYDQFLNYHATIRQEDDAYLQQLDDEMKNNAKKFQLTKSEIAKHYAKFDKEKVNVSMDNTNNNNNNNNNRIDYLKYWSNMLNYFENNNETVEEAIRRLSHIKSLITKYNNNNLKEKEKCKDEPSFKKRKLNDGTIIDKNKNTHNSWKNKKKNDNTNNNNNNNNPQNKTDKKKKKRNQRSWEVSSSDEDNDNNNNNNNKNKNDGNVKDWRDYKLDDISNMNIKEREYYEKGFDQINESSTILFSNGDKHILEMTKNGLLNRIKQYKERFNKSNNYNNNNNNNRSNNNDDSVVGERTAPRMGDAKLNAENQRLSAKERERAREEARRELEEMRRERRDREAREARDVTQNDLEEMRIIRENLRKQQELELKQMREMEQEKAKGKNETKKMDKETMLNDLESSDDDDDDDNNDIDNNGGSGGGGDNTMKEWYYYWKNDATKQEYGPFTNQSMMQWNESNFFKQQPICLITRKEKENNGKWICSDDVEDLSTLFA